MRRSWKGSPWDASRYNDAVERLATKYLSLLDGETGEHEVHDFLKKHPFLLMTGILGGGADLERVALFSKLRLGDEHVTDFALVTADSDGARWTLVELESPKAALFTKAGDPSAELTHGLRQLDDWSRFFKRDPAYAKRRLGEVHQNARIRGPIEIWRAPTYMVVIGRETSLTPDTRARRAEMNDNHPRRQIATYDRLNPRRWAERRPEGIFDDEHERGEATGTPWPEDPEVPWNLSPNALDALAEARRTGQPTRVKDSRDQSGT